MKEGSCISESLCSPPFYKDGINCLKCEGLNVLENNSCIPGPCRDKYGVNGNNECLKCQDLGKKWQIDRCITGPCTGIYGVNPENEFECIDCKSKDKLLHDGGCVEVCPEGLGPNSEKICIECKNEQVWLEGKCLDCDEGFKLNKELN